MGTISAFERWWLDSWLHRLHVRMRVPRFLRSCPEPFRGEVLEVGAGSGWTSRRILDNYPQVELTATDLDPRAVKAYQHLEKEYGQRLNMKAADVLALPFDRGAFDIVVAMHVLHHIPDVPKAISELMRVLRPGGLIGITDEDQRYVIGPLRWLWRSNNNLGREALEAAITAAGGEIVVGDGGVHFTLWARKPYPVNPAIQ